MIGAGPGNWCFPTRWSEPLASQVSVRISLHAPHARALARLIPILGCGEEAASLAFDGLARSCRANRVASAALRQVAAEERIHDGLMHGLAAGLPPPGDERAIRAARRMHIQLGLGGFETHLARIAALDAAVCTVLSRLLRAGQPLTDCPQVRRILGQVHRDEARHVALTRSLVLAHGASSRLRDIGADARGALAAVMMIEADAFEVLRVDPARLNRDICRLPDGLLRA